MLRMIERIRWRLLFCVAGGLSFLLYAMNLVFGNLNQDEGWYLYAAGEVARGAVLYRDVMFTQGPVFPLIYRFFHPVVDAAGLAGGRVVTALLGMASVGCAVWLAGRLVVREQRAAACSAALILIGVNVTWSLFTTVVKTYALTAFFLTAGFALLTYARGRHAAGFSFSAGALLALAALTRLSAGLALPLAGIWLLYTRPATPVPSRIPPWVAFGAGGSLVLLVLLGPFFAADADRLHFALFGYHTGRDSGTLLQQLVLKAGFISRFVQAFFIATAGTVLLLFWRPKKPALRDPSTVLWVTVGAVTLLHLAAPFPYDDYQIVIVPLLGAALAAAFARRCSGLVAFRACTLLLLLSMAAAFSSPVNQSWFVRGQDRIWWRFKDVPDLVLLRRVGQQLRQQLGEGAVLLTQDTYLAVEARARVPSGMEMGPFSYYPDLCCEQAARMNVLNRRRLLALLEEANAPMAAISGYGLAIASPQIRELRPEEQAELREALNQNYKPLACIPHFGQGHTTLELFVRQDLADNLPRIDSPLSQ